MPNKYLAIILLLIIQINFEVLIAQPNPTNTPITSPVKTMENSKKPPIDSSLQMGIGYGLSTKFLKSDDSSNLFLPFINFNNDSFFLRGITFGYKLSKSWPMINLLLTPYMLEVDNKEGTFNSDMRKRRRTLHSGIQFLFPLSWISIRFQLEQDILNIHKSNLVTLSFSKNFQLANKLQLMAGPFFTRQTKTLTNYYFGIENDEIKLDRQAYNPSYSIIYGPNLNLIYFLDEKRHWMTNFNLKHSIFSNSIENSPLVTKGYQTSYSLQILKSF